jgi:hypothetical protein
MNVEVKKDILCNGNKINSDTLAFTKPNIFIVQSRLFTPNYMGTGRWVIIDPKTRKSLVAVGKDEVPLILRVLVIAESGKRISAIAEELNVNEEVIIRLFNSGLLVHEKDYSECSKHLNYMESYHEMVFEYPFHDYSKDGWKDRDRAQMSQYGIQALPPESITIRNGKTVFKLPPPSLEIFTIERNVTLVDFAEPLVLGTLLHITFGIIEVIPSDWPMLRKTSPSGGGRHPAEAIVFIPENKLIPEGVYYYDVQNHSLVLVEDRIYQSQINNKVGIAITAKVERPMWRYREPRSWRAVCIDIGHVDETFGMLVGLLGGVVERKNSPQDIGPAYTWMNEPELSYMEIYNSSVKSIEQKKYKEIVEEIVCEEDADYLTNPLMFMRIHNNGILAETLWPKCIKSNIDFEDYIILNYSLPSRRGDRPTDYSILVKEFSSSKDRIDKLIKLGFLVNGKCARKVYDNVYLWSKHNWYLSFLSLLGFKKNIEENESIVSMPKLKDNNSENILDILYKRKTVRSFLKNNISKESVQKIFSSILKDYKKVPVKIYGAMLHVDGYIENGLYTLNDNNELVYLSKTINAEQIKAATIGQAWAGVGALTIWIVAKVNLKQPFTYQNALMELGRYGQRLCLQVTNQNLGIFVTPAVCDKATCNLLEEDDPFNSIIYTMTIGYERK